jgi:RimJ/RimL family protein N-acetyltransferase
MSTSDLPTEIWTPRTVIRRAAAADLPELAAWPAYPWPYDGLSLDRAVLADDGRRWWEQIDLPDRVNYSVVLPADGRIVGVIALTHINRAAATVGNMGVRIHPAHCGKGYGTETVGAVLKATLDNGIDCIRLDVASTNERAIRCYHTCGMRVVEEFWRDGDGPADPDEPRWQPLMRHLRRKGDAWAVLFYWMEIRRYERGRRDG